jgi:hypothetical protein
MPDHLQQIAAAPTEAKQMSAQRIVPQHLLNLQGQGSKTLSHIGVAGGQPYSHASRDWNHRRRLVFASAFINADTVAAPPNQ